MTDRQATTARVVSSVLGALFLGGAGYALYANAATLAALPATHLGALIAVAVLGAFLIDPGHVGAALGALIAAAKQAKAAAPPSTDGAPE